MSCLPMPAEASDRIDKAAERRAVGMLAQYESRTLGDLHEDYWWVRRRAEVVRLLRRNLDQLPASLQLVELGCGTGPDTLLLAGTMGDRLADYCCTDFNEVDLEVCRRRHEVAGFGRGSYRQVDLTKPLPWAEGSLDLVYAAEVFEHMADVTPLLGELARVVRPGGFVLFTTPNEPNVLQRSYWSRRRREAVQGEMEAAGNDLGGGKIYNSHVGLKPWREWDRLMRASGFELTDAGRGALWYRPGRLARWRVTFAAQLVVETLIDLPPRRWMRWLSDGQIGLYRRSSNP